MSIYTAINPTENKKLKPDLVLIHGWGFNNSIWHFNLDYLNTHYNLHFIELNGHGSSKYNHNFSDIEFYCTNLIQQIPDNSNILGWSLGGNIALNLKYYYPEKINKVILCCSNPCFLSKPNWNSGINQNIWDKFSENLLLNTNKTLKEFILLQTLNHPASKNLYKNILNIINNSKQASIHGLSWGLNILKQDYRFILDKINDMSIPNNSKIKFILGAKDALVPKSLSGFLSATYPNIDSIVLEKSGHLPFITQPDEFYQNL